MTDVPRPVGEACILSELAQQVRRDTLLILEAAEADWLTFAPRGTSNHILWHAGHALWVQDILCVEPLSGTSELPPDWADTFGMNCRPVADTTTWPSRGEVTDLLQRQLRRVLGLLADATAEQLASVADPSRGPAKISERIIHGWHDEAKHCGEMYLLLKLRRGGGS